MFHVVITVQCSWVPSLNGLETQQAEEDYRKYITKLNTECGQWDSLLKTHSDLATQAVE